MQIANEAPASYRTSAERPGALTLVTTAFRETLSRRRLIQYLVAADIKKKGTDTLLGNLWWMLDPLIAMAVYVFVMEVIFQRALPDFPLFLLAAVIMGSVMALPLLLVSLPVMAYASRELYFRTFPPAAPAT